MSANLTMNRVVQVALELGFLPYGANRTARKHFAWYLPDCEENQRADFEVNFFNGIPSYRVGDQGTTYQPSAIKWLRELAEKTQRAS